jgi:GNAT superfamily N-acetyltransferase
MPRQAPRIRDARPDDAWDLLDLWATVSGLGDHTSQPDRSVMDAEQALATIALDPDQRLLVAEHEDRIVAAMKLSRGPLWPLAMDQAVHSSFLLVLPQYRRHGYGHALMEAALLWAEEKDITQITVVTDGNRDTNRFFARLGLGNFGNVRHATTGALRKKLVAERPHAGNRHLVEVLAQRRSMRRRQAAG